jgi:hypothetical protein
MHFRVNLPLIWETAASTYQSVEQVAVPTTDEDEAAAITNFGRDLRPRGGSSTAKDSREASQRPQHSAATKGASAERGRGRRVKKMAYAKTIQSHIMIDSGESHAVSSDSLGQIEFLHVSKFRPAQQQAECCWDR